MAWEERRNGRRYYYRSRRIGGRVVKHYVGAGVAGEKAAAEDAAERQRRACIAKAQNAAQRSLEEIDNALADLDVITDALTRAILAAAGFHQHHRGEWRKRRG